MGFGRQVQVHGLIDKDINTATANKHKHVHV